MTIFAKGNVDVRDSLHSLRIGGAVLWNGINEVVRRRFPGTIVRVSHETFTRSDALLEADGRIPPAVSARDLRLAPNTAASQYSQALFESDAAAVVLSVQPDLMTSLLRHRSEGYVFHPANSETWDAADQDWLRDEFTFSVALEVEASMRNFAAIVARLRERSDVPILVYNVSAVVPGDQVHSHQGLDETLSTRIRRFNLGLIELSRETGISIIDVDGIVARAGADRAKLDAVHLTAEGCRLVAEDVVRVLDDLGCFTSAEAPGCA